MSTYLCVIQDAAKIYLNTENHVQIALFLEKNKQ